MQNIWNIYECKEILGLRSGQKPFTLLLANDVRMIFSTVSENLPFSNVHGIHDLRIFVTFECHWQFPYCRYTWIFVVSIFISCYIIFISTKKETMYWKYITILIIAFSCTTASLCACLPVLIHICMLDCVSADPQDWLRTCLPTCLSACVYVCLATWWHWLWKSGREEHAYGTLKYFSLSFDTEWF